MRSLSRRRLTSARTKWPALSVSASGCSRSPRTRRAPSWAMRMAVARPIPLAAPVITAAFPARRPSLLVGTQALPGGAKSIDAELDDVTVGEKAGRLLAEPDARGSAGGDHVAGKERHELTDVADKPGYVDHEILRRAGLLGLSVHLEPQAEVVHVRDLVGRGEKRAERREGVAALALHPLAAALELEGPLRVVVVEHVARHVLPREHGVSLDIAGAAANDDCELHLPMGLGAAFRDDHVVVGAAQGGRGLEEQYRLCRDRLSCFLGVIAIIQADAHDLARPRDRGSQADRVPNSRCGPAVGGEPARQPLEPTRPKERLVVVRAERGGVDASSVSQDQSRPFLPHFTE